MNNHGNVTIAALLVICSIIILIGIALNAYNQIQIELTHCHLDKVRAKMLAHQGIANATSQLKSLDFDEIVNKPQASGEAINGWYYYGEDLDANSLLNRGEDQNNNSTLDVETCLLRNALRPSFMLTDPNTNSPLFIRSSKGSRMGYSGELTQTYQDGKDIYTLKITDCHSRIYLNGNDDGTRCLLNNLGVILRISSDIPDGALGDYLFKKRLQMPSGMLTVQEELATILPKTVYEKIKPYVTIYGQPDSKVIKPSRHRLKEGTKIFSWREIIPDDLIQEERHPININTASKPVLMATLANLKGIYLHQGLSDEELEKSGNIKDVFSNELEKPLGRIEADQLAIGKLKSVSLQIPENIRTIESIAERIIEERARYPFLEWQVFNDFCDNLVQEELFGDISTTERYEQAQAQADLIKANANPNTLLNKFNPDRVIYHSLDKSDLVTYTTEFCFTPRGYFEIESRGMVFRPAISGGMILEADYLTRSVVRVYEIYNETTQSDFSRGHITLHPKKETATLQTYPQPDIDNLPKRCDEDGQIALASIENKSQMTDTFTNHFSKTLKAHQSKGKAQPLEIEGNNTATGSLFNGGVLYPDGVYSDSGSCPTYESENNIVDGIACERLYGKKQFRGAVSLWIKQNYYQTSIKPRTIFTLNKATNNPPHPKYNYQTSQHIFSLMAFPRAYPYNPDTDQLANSLRTTPAGKYLWFWEIDESLGNQPQEYIFANSDLTDDNHHRWLHIGIAWDTHPKSTRISKPCPACMQTSEQPVKETSWLLKNYCRHCLGTGEISEIKVYQSDVYTFCLNGDDSQAKYVCRQPELFPPEIIQQVNFASGNSIRLGENIESAFWNFPGDFTIDEVAIKFPDNVGDAKASFKEEFTSGRYYKNPGVFTSGTITLKTPNVFKTKIIPTWTVYYPSNWDKKSRNVMIQLLNNSETPVSSLHSKQGAIAEIPMDKKRNLSFKYQLIFTAGGADTDIKSLNKPLLESPFLDDINLIIFRNEPEIIEQFVVEN